MEAINWLIALICLVLYLPIHEAGHYVLSWYFGFKPTFGHDGLTTVYVCSRLPAEITDKIKLKGYIMAFGGIIGVIPFFVVLQETWWIILFWSLYSVSEVYQRWRFFKKLQFTTTKGEKK